MKTEEQLINNIIGQLSGLKEMISKDRDCTEVIIQMKASKSALQSLMAKYAQRKFIQCLKQCKDKESKEQLCKKFFKEITECN